jgi:threonine synthase
MAMLHVSTRGEAPKLSFSDALLAGLARDGGLYVPESWPSLSSRQLQALQVSPIRKSRKPCWAHYPMAIFRHRI